MLKECIETRNSNQSKTKLIGVTVLTSFSDKEIKEVGLNDTVNNQVVRLAKLAAINKLDGIVCSPQEIKNIKLEIKTNLSPKHIPSKIFEVSDIPKTKSGKIVELSIKNIINGIEIENENALANPDCLKEYQSIYNLLKDN